MVLISQRLGPHLSLLGPQEEVAIARNKKKIKGFIRDMIRSAVNQIYKNIFIKKSP